MKLHPLSSPQKKAMIPPCADLVSQEGIYLLITVLQFKSIPSWVLQTDSLHLRSNSEHLQQWCADSLCSHRPSSERSACNCTQPCASLLLAHTLLHTPTKTSKESSLCIEPTPVATQPTHSENGKRGRTPAQAGAGSVLIACMSLFHWEHFSLGERLLPSMKLVLSFSRSY